MHIINDFFLLVWGKRCDEYSLGIEEQKALDKALLEDSEMLCDAIAIVLAINPHNASNILATPCINQIVDRFHKHQSISQKEIQTLQKEVFSWLILQGSKALNQSILKRFERLSQEEIISYDHLRAITGLFHLIPEKKAKTDVFFMKETTQQENYYKTALHTLEVAIENLHTNIEIPSLLSRLDAVSERLVNQRFSVGITGVMNAGKSTMLNALLGQEILGTSVVPETANLTLIKYAKTPYAVVNFWNSKEWSKIEEGAKTLKSLEAFVQESKAHFGKTFETIITPEGKHEVIAVENLASYTSAKHSDKKCNLVKSVELYTDLKFVQDGVQIVDTPGLDDPVVQREEITLEYLSECDLMIHLMNAAQAATQKDIDFIIDALLYRNVARLLVVITRIDMIQQKELEEVIAYTKRSIEARLKEQNKGSKLDEVIEKIVFIPIAGKLALMHKLGQEKEALALGYDLARTGLPSVEAYLEEVLFGSNSQKVHLIISANQNEIESIIAEALSAFEQEGRLLKSSNQEIEQAYQAHQAKKKAMMHFVEQIQNSVVIYQEEMKHYFITLQKFAINRLDTLQSIAKRRISEDVSYELTKHKKLPKEERIGAMIETAIKDGIVDLIRDYRYEFQKKMQSILEYMQAQYGEFQSDATIQTLDAKAFCEEHLGSLLIFKNNSVLIAGVNEAIKKYAKNDQNALGLALDKLFSAEFFDLKEMLEKKLMLINQDLLVSFTSVCEAPAKTLQERSHTQEEILEKAMHDIKNTTLNREERIGYLEEKERILGLVLNNLAMLKEQK